MQKRDWGIHKEGGGLLNKKVGCCTRRWGGVAQLHIEGGGLRKGYCKDKGVQKVGRGSALWQQCARYRENGMYM